ncbi:MAG: hypothetical protein WAW86_10090 [Gammaproteobacteria bacterium]
MINNEQAFQAYLATSFQVRSLKEYRDIPEIKERILLDSINGTMPDTPGSHTIAEARIELERKIAQNAWPTPAVAAPEPEPVVARKAGRGLFGLFKPRDQAVKQDPNNSPTVKRK